MVILPVRQRRSFTAEHGRNERWTYAGAFGVRESARNVYTRNHFLVLQVAQYYCFNRCVRQERNSDPERSENGMK